MIISSIDDILNLLMVKGFLLVALALVLSTASISNGMEFAVVGEPNNDPDQLYKRGGVDYVFEIGKYKVTNDDYAQFLNAVAHKSDPFELYSPSMSTGLLGGINRDGTEGRYTYRSKPGWGHRPVVYISWYDLARMANWYHFAKPNDGTSRLGTTEGTDKDGAYDTRHFPLGYSDEMNYSQLPDHRNLNALYWIPSDNEWYKAAYYDPRRIGCRKYWDYAVRTSNQPNNLPPPGNELSVNYFNGTFAIGKPYFLTEVGSYPKATNYFGTYDMNGNVWEWVEDWAPMRVALKKKGRITRGGSASYSEEGLHAQNADPLNPAHEAFVFGGRLGRAFITKSGQVNIPRVATDWFSIILSKSKIKNFIVFSPPKIVFLSCATVGFLLAIGLWVILRVFQSICRFYYGRKTKSSSMMAKEPRI
jgi:formylglycine-generating enzyme required for sulfatase activity